MGILFQILKILRDEYIMIIFIWKLILVFKRINIEIKVL